MKTIFLLGSLLFAFNLVLAQEDPDPLRFSSEIAVFDSLDAADMPPKGCILFIGSSSIRMWKSAEKTFKKYQVINRGFGGSQASDANFFYDRLVKLYSPSKILYYEGDNDLAVGKTPERFMKDFKIFVEKVEKDFPSTVIYFLSIKPSPSRWELADAMQTTNKMVIDYCKEKENLEFVDVFEPMLGKDGRPIPKIFTSDSLHMNPKGYKIWKKAVKPILEAR